MANPGMQITIGANVSAAVAGLNQVNAAAAATGRGLSALAPAIAPNLQGLTLLGSASNNAAAGLGNLGNAAGTVGRSIGSLAPLTRPSLQGLTLLGSAGANAGRGLSQLPPAINATAAAAARARNPLGAANGALVDFGRVAQDLPYGIVGITNNLTQLPETLGRLSAAARESGRSMGSLLLSSVSGFAGIGLAFSVVTSAFLIYQNGIAGFNRKTKEASDKAKEFTDSLKSIADITAEASGGVQGQIAQVQALANVVTDTNNSYKERNRALRELSQINKAYFGDLKLEEGQMSVLTSRVNEYTDALVQQAVIKGFTDEISRVAPELNKQNKALEATRNRLTRLRKELEATPSEVVDVRGNVQTNKAYQNLLNQITKTNKEFLTQRDTVEVLATNMAQLRGEIQGAVKEGLKFRDLTNDSTNKGAKEVDILKQRIDALKKLREETGLGFVQRRELFQLEVQLLLRDGKKEGFTAGEIQDRIDELIRSTGDALSKAAPSEITVPLILVPRPIIDVAGATLPGGQIAEDYGKAIGGKINAGVKQGLDISPIIQDAFQGLGETIGEVISGTGNVSDIFQGVFQAIGAALKEFGKALIAYGVAAKAIKLAIKNPFIAIAAGVGLIAAGSILQKSIPAFANGVTGFAGGLALVGDRGPELVNLPRGADVIPNHQIGGVGTNRQVVEVEGVFRGGDIYLANKRESERRRRI